MKSMSSAVFWAQPLLQPWCWCRAQAIGTKMEGTDGLRAVLPCAGIRAERRIRGDPLEFPGMMASTALLHHREAQPWGCSAPSGPHSSQGFAGRFHAGPPTSLLITPPSGPALLPKPSLPWGGGSALRTLAVSSCRHLHPLSSNSHHQNPSTEPPSQNQKAAFPPRRRRFQSHQSCSREAQQLHLGATF